MKKKLCLFLCLVIIVTALASVAFARDEICSYCNARVKFYDTSDTYLLMVYSTLCLYDDKRMDIIYVWAKDYLYRCSNPECGIENFSETKIVKQERSCNHV